MGHCQITTTDRYCHLHSTAVVIDVARLTGGGVSGRCEPEKETAEPEGPASVKVINISG